MFRRIALLATAISLTAQVQVMKETKQPAKFREELFVLPSGWATRIPGQGSVNVPGMIKQLAPGQKFSVALVADGEGRENLLAGRSLSTRITTGAGTFEKRDLKPISIRDIKATGSDMILMLLDAGGIKKQDKEVIERKTTMVSLAIFEIGWEAPSIDKEENILVEAKVAGDVEPVPSIKPIHLPLRPWADWRREPEADQAAIEKLLNGFHECPEPGRLLPMLQAVARSKALEQPPIHSFLATAFHEFPLARQEAIKLLPSLDPLSKWALLLVLRLGGEEISSMMDGLPEDAKSSLISVQPLKDPRVFSAFIDPVDPQRIAGMGVQMDYCWGGWLATGDPSFLRALVGLLSGAPDFQTYQTWVKTKGGLKGLNAQVARGMAYQISGWSLSSFQRSDPQVSDWLLYWQRDADIPSIIQDQIRTLSNNPAFQKPK